MRELSWVLEMFDILIGTVGTWVYTLSKIITYALESCAFHCTYGALKELQRR